MCVVIMGVEVGVEVGGGTGGLRHTVGRVQVFAESWHACGRGWCFRYRVMYWKRWFS